MSELLKPELGDCLPCAERARRRREDAALIAQAPQPDDLPKNAPRYLRAPDVSLEYAAHCARQGRPYSAGHQRMYSGPIELLTSTSKEPLDILEVGFGVGYGLKKMVEAGIVGNYWGVEPDPASFEHTFRELRLLGAHCGAGHRFYEIEIPGRARVTLLNSTLAEAAQRDDDRTSEAPILPAVDFVFCIEVIEHVQAADVPAFLKAIHKRTRRALFLSTPDATTSAHGVATAAEWKRVIKLAGFDVATVARQWTTLFICEPRG